MLNAQQLMAKTNQFSEEVRTLQTTIADCVADIVSVEKSGLELKTELAEWQQGLDQAILHNRKMTGSSAVQTNGHGDKPVAELVLDYIRTHPGANAAAITNFLAEQRQNVSKSTIQYSFNKLRDAKSIRTKGGRGHRTYWPVEARA